VCPTGINYYERLAKPYRSVRNVSVYGSDRKQRLNDLPRDMAAFEKAVNSVCSDIKKGYFDMIREI